MSKASLYIYVSLFALAALNSLFAIITEKILINTESVTFMSTQQTRISFVQRPTLFIFFSFPQHLEAPCLIHMELNLMNMCFYRRK